MMFLVSTLFLLHYGSTSLPHKPHILLILSDDQGYQDAGFRGSDILTPHLDQLAREGVILENHYVMPTCSPSRASLMSGRYAIRTGFWRGNVKPDEEWGLGLNETTMAEMLKRNGYATHGVGKWHCGMYTWGHTPAQRGFDSFLGLYLGSQKYFTHRNHYYKGSYDHEEGFIDLRENYYTEAGEFVDKMRSDLTGQYNTDIFTDHAKALINQHDQTQPLFLYLSYTAPHTPWEAPGDTIANFTSHMTTADLDRRTYAAQIYTMDAGIGEVVRELEQRGMRSNTLIIFSSDNGAVYDGPGSNYPLRGGKTSLFEGGVRALSFVNSPLLERTGYVNTNLHHVTDWFATFQALARDEPALHNKTQLPVDGLNIWESISGNGSSGRSEVLINYRNSSLIDNEEEARQGGGAEEEFFFVLRWENWKMFAGSYPDKGWTSENSSSGTTPSPGTTGTRLFDLSSDPREMADVAAQHPDVVEQMLLKMRGYEENVTRVQALTNSSAGQRDGGWYPWVGSGDRRSVQAAGLCWMILGLCVMY